MVPMTCFLQMPPPHIPCEARGTRANMEDSLSPTLHLRYLPTGEGGALPLRLGFRPQLVSAPFPVLAARDPSPYPLRWLYLPLAIDPPPLSLLQ